MTPFTVLYLQTIVSEAGLIFGGAALGAAQTSKEKIGCPAKDIADGTARLKIKLQIKVMNSVLVVFMNWVSFLVKR